MRLENSETISFNISRPTNVGVGAVGHGHVVADPRTVVPRRGPAVKQT